jgi:hypothetical protein
MYWYKLDTSNMPNTTTGGRLWRSPDRELSDENTAKKVCISA